MKSKDKIAAVIFAIAAAVAIAVGKNAAKHSDKAPPPKVKVEKWVDNPITRRIPSRAEKLIDDPAPTITLNAEERREMFRAIKANPNALDEPDEFNACRFNLANCDEFLDEGMESRARQITE